MAGKGEFKEMEEEEDMGWGKRYMLHPSRFGVKGLPPGLQPGERSFGKEKPQEKKRGGCGKGMEGRRIKLEKGGGGGRAGGLQHPARLQDLPLVFNHFYSRGRKPAHFPDKTTFLPAWGCCPPPPVEGHRPAPRGRGKNPSCPHLLPLCFREDEEHPIPLPRDSPGHLHPFPLAFFPFTPSPSPHPALLPPLPHLQTFSSPKRKKKPTNFWPKGKREKNHSLRELNSKPWLWWSVANQPLLVPSQHCSIAGQKHL